MERLVIYRAREGRLRPHAQRAYQALCACCTGMVTDGADFRQTLTEALHAPWDEILLVSDELLGPIGCDGLQELLSAMETRSADAWALARGADPQAPPAQGQTPTAVPTFLALRRPVLESPALRRLLEAEQGDVAAAIAALIDREGMTLATLIPADTQELSDLDPLQTLPYSAVVKYGCPFVDVRCFTLPHALLLETSMGEEPGRLMRHISEQGAYDTDLIWDLVLAGSFDLNTVRNLGLMTSLPVTPCAHPAPATDVCLIMHLYFTDLGQEALHYAASMPPEADIYVNTVSDEKKAFYEALFARLPNRVEIRVTPNRGRDMGCLLIGMRDVLLRYDLCCFYHDKKSAFNSVPSVGRSFAYLISESALASPGYVQRIIRLFSREPRLGVVCPMVPHHGDYYGVSAHFWDHNFPQAQALLERLKVDVPVAPDADYPAAWGSIFWFRPAALRPLTDYPWQYEDFPPEPYPVDGSVAHAIERIHCMVAQSRGYYARIAAPDHLAGLQLMNFHLFTRDYLTVMDRAQALGQHRVTVHNFSSTANCLQARARRVLRKAAKRLLGEGTILRVKKLLRR